MMDWHGWSIRGRGSSSLHIGYLPGRKSPCLYEQEGGTIRTLAFFKDEVAARKALAFIDAIGRLGD